MVEGYGYRNRSTRRQPILNEETDADRRRRSEKVHGQRGAESGGRSDAKKLPGERPRHQRGRLPDQRFDARSLSGGGRRSRNYRLSPQPHAGVRRRSTEGGNAL